jgi:hypothetical protein
MVPSRTTKPQSIARAVAAITRSGDPDLMSGIRLVDSATRKVQEGPVGESEAGRRVPQNRFEALGHGCGNSSLASQAGEPELMSGAL